jgi:hypothetical protein
MAVQGGRARCVPNNKAQNFLAFPTFAYYFLAIYIYFYIMQMLIATANNHEKPKPYANQTTAKPIRQPNADAPTVKRLHLSRFNSLRPLPNDA